MKSVQSVKSRLQSLFLASGDLLKIKYDSNLMGLMNTFVHATGIVAKDCLIDDNGLLTFIVPENTLGRAIGKKGFKVHLIERTINRKIKIVEFNPELISFVQNLVAPSKAKRVWMENKTVMIEPLDSFNRGNLIGRAAQNLRNNEKIIKRYFEIDEIKVK